LAYLNKTQTGYVAQFYFVSPRPAANKKKTAGQGGAVTFHLPDSLRVLFSS